MPFIIWGTRGISSHVGAWRFAQARADRRQAFLDSLRDVDWFAFSQQAQRFGERAARRLKESAG